MNNILTWLLVRLVSYKTTWWRAAAPSAINHKLLFLHFPHEIHIFDDINPHTFFHHLQQNLIQYKSLACIFYSMQLFKLPKSFHCKLQHWFLVQLEKKFLTWTSNVGVQQMTNIRRVCTAVLCCCWDLLEPLVGLARDCFLRDSDVAVRFFRSFQLPSPEEIFRAGSTSLSSH